MKCNKHKQEMRYEDRDCSSCEGGGRDGDELDGECVMCWGRGYRDQWRCDDCDQEERDAEDEADHVAEQLYNRSG